MKVSKGSSLGYVERIVTLQTGDELAAFYWALREVMRDKTYFTFNLGVVKGMEETLREEFDEAGL
ncbi:hypothetical protein LCGC14_0940320 [marine sediment metagenome]|uniref:Uncharacterized protein n=1 Tax=marine sediment metagenome TaxID=412755 RepID=A0A0F9NPZ2_9ZZZZ